MKRMFSGWVKLATFLLSLGLPFIVAALIKKDIRILDLVFSSLILVLFWSVVIVAIDLGKHEQHLATQGRLPRLRFDREVFFVLYKIAGKGANNVGQVEMNRDQLESKYLQYFETNKRDDFNGLISKLASRHYVDDRSHVFPERYCIINREGFALLERYKHRKKWKREAAKIAKMRPGVVILHSEIS